MTHDALFTLLEGMRRGDQHAARALWDAAAPRLTAYAAALLRGGIADSAADDVVQRVFIRALGAEGQSGGTPSVEDVLAYLAAAVRREALSSQRSASRRARYEQEPRPRASTRSPSVDDDALRDALDALPDPEREPLLLRFCAGLSLDAAARVLDEPRSTVAARAARGLEALRARLAVPSPTPRPTQSATRSARSMEAPS